MPYAKTSELPSNVPVAHAKQFLEVFNSAWKAAKDDKKSDAQAEETSFAQAWGVITKAGAKPKDRDVSSDGPGFGPVEKVSEDGGQVSDPQMSLRALEEEVAAAFTRYVDERGGPGSGPHAGGGKVAHEGHDAILKEAGYSQTDKKGEYKDADGNRVQVSKSGAFTTTSKTYQLKVGTTADDLKSAIAKRFAADQPRDPDGKFAAGSTGENAHTTEEHLKAAADHVTLAKQELARGDKEHSKMHEAAAHDHLKAAFAPNETKEAVGSIARVSSHTANTFPDENVGRSQTECAIEYRWGF